MIEPRTASSRAGRFVAAAQRGERSWRVADVGRASLVLAVVVVGLLSLLALGGWRVAAYVAGISDLTSYHLPKYEYVADRLAAGALPLWNPYEFGGIPFLASLQPGVFYPPVAFFYTLASGELAHVLFFFFHLAVGAVATLLLMRAIGCRLWPSVLAAVWVTQPLWLVRVYDHPNFIATACWIPLLLLCLRRCILVPSLRAATALAVVAALQFLAGYPPVTFATTYLMLLSVPFWLLEARATRGGRVRQGVAALAVAGVVCALVVSAQLLPTAELVLQSNRQSEAASMHERLLALGEGGYSSLFLIAMPQMTWRAAAYEFWTCFGPLLIALCVVAAALLWRRPAALFLVAAVVLSGLLPYPAYTRLPFYGHVRWALEWHFIAPQMVFALAGLGLDALLSRGWLPGRRAAAVAVGTAVLSAAWNWQLVDARWLRPVSTAAAPVPDWAAQRCALDDQRFRAYWPQGLIRGNLFVARLRSIGGYEQSLLPARTARLIDTIGIGNGVPPPRWAKATAINRKIVARMALRCLITPVAPILERGGFLRFAPAGSALKVYTNPNALPRARLARRPHFAASPEEALGFLRAGKGGEVVLEGPPAALPDQACDGAAGEARIILDQPEEVRVATTAACASYLVLSDTNLPGWTATVDGVPAPILAADYAFRAVVVPGGAHEVVFRYAPWTVPSGLVLSLVGLVTATGLVLLPRRYDPLRRDPGDR